MTIFVKDYLWVYDNLYHPYIHPATSVALLGLLPIALLFMIFRRTRILGGISLFLLSTFFGFSLWFYSLMIAASHGPGWVIGGIILCGIGVIATALVSSAIWGQWVVAVEILTGAVLIWLARTVGWIVVQRQLEKDT